MGLKRAILQSMLTAASVLATPCAFADDAPVEKPAVDRPALPQPSPGAAASPTQSSAPTHASGQGEPQHRANQSGGAHTATGTQAGGGARPFFYAAAGPGLLWGLSGGEDFERLNPALTGAAGFEIPLGPATGLGFELNGDVELASEADRGTYTALLVRARLGRMLTPRNRLWGALGLGAAGYQNSSFAFNLAAGTSLMLVPKFGLDFSANLNVLGASSGSNNPTIQDDYPGGALLLFAVRALFELHR
ncbi:MAG TPA: hypothetical protein VER04_17090 [Polyangiaceae bacterium]|nr:hypothetical protein [Polyangiaceae bacterium]